MTSQPEVLVEKPRISSIDLLRGIVMVIMALDHTRDFFHISSFRFDPTDPAVTSPALYFTRWITHLCAPTFVLLSGTAIRLSLQRKSKKDMALFLWTRGLWLVFLEFTVVRFSFFFNLYYDFTVVQVIYAIGMSMIMMAALIQLNDRTILIAGIIIVAGHDVLNYFRIAPESPFFAPATFIYQGGPIALAPGKVFMVGYPFLPWLGILMLGYSMGQWFLKGFDPAARHRYLMQTGVGAIALFLTLRLINIYGDPAPWQVQATGWRTFLSFMNCTKYPVSLLYTLMTLGPMLIVLAWMENVSVTRWKPLEVFGRVPMFYYIGHFYMIHILAIVAFLVVRHKSFADLDFHFSTGDNFFAAGPGNFGGVPIGAGYPLVWVYAVWLFVVVAMYPLCKRYNEYKSHHHQWWLSYL